MMSRHQDTRFFVVPHVDGCLVYGWFMGLELVYGWVPENWGMVGKNG